MAVENLQGQFFGQYELRQLIGKGGMGAVYRAYQSSLGREVAIKVLPASLATQEGYVERFNREARTAAALEHPHIIPVYDYGTQQDTSYVVMRMLTGGTLSDRMKQRNEARRPMPTLHEVADLLKRLASAMDYAHSQGVIHRDIKGTNVMFDAHGTPFLVDFGIAKLVEATTKLTNEGTSMGTPAYMPPEQWRGEQLTPAADQYALAVVIYSLITEKMPFEAGTPYALMHKHINEMPTPPHVERKDIPEAISPVLEVALSKDPSMRFPTVTAFAEAFENSIADTAAGAEATEFFTFELTRLPAPATQTVNAGSRVQEGAVDDGPTITPEPPPPITPGSGSQQMTTGTQSGFGNPWVLIVLILTIGAVVTGIALAVILGAADDEETADNNGSSAINLTATGEALSVAGTETAIALVPTETDPPTPSPTSTRTSSPTPSVPQGRVLRTTAPVLLGPDNAYPQIGFVAVGDRVDIIEVSRDGRWLRIDTGSLTGFVPAGDIEVTAGQLSGLPFATFPTLTPTPSDTPTNTPTPTATPSPSATNTPTATDTPSITPTPSDTSTPTLTGGEIARQTQAAIATQQARAQAGTATAIAMSRPTVDAIAQEPIRISGMGFAGQAGPAPATLPEDFTFSYQDIAGVSAYAYDVMLAVNGELEGEPYNSRLNFELARSPQSNQGKLIIEGEGPLAESFRDENIDRLPVTIGAVGSQGYFVLLDADDQAVCLPISDTRPQDVEDIASLVGEGLGGLYEFLASNATFSFGGRYSRDGIDSHLYRLMNYNDGRFELPNISSDLWWTADERVLFAYYLSVTINEQNRSLYEEILVGFDPVLAESDTFRGTVTIWLEPIAFNDSALPLAGPPAACEGVLDSGQDS